MCYNMLSLRPQVHLQDFNLIKVLAVIELASTEDSNQVPTGVAILLSSQVLPQEKQPLLNLTFNLTLNDMVCTES